MPQNTPNRAYTYPLYGDTQDFPADIQELAEDFDLDIQALVDQIDGAKNRPSVAIFSVTPQVVAAAATTTLTWSTVSYDNDTMANLGTGVTLNDDGIYLLIVRVTLEATATVTTQSLEVAFASSAGFIAQPARQSKPAPGNVGQKIFNLFALHYTDGSVPDNITVTFRHDDPAGVTVGARDLMASKVSNLLSGS